MSPEAARKANQNTPPLTGIAERAYRVMPHNLEAEQGLLGALLIDNRVMEKIGDTLKASHFFHPAHQRIFAAIHKLIDRGQTASPITLKGYFEQDQDLSSVGGAEYLTELAASVISIVAVPDDGIPTPQIVMPR